MKTNKTSYDKIAEKWVESRNKSKTNKCVVDFCQKLVPNGKILDIGCGSGYPIAKYLSDKGFTVTGIDISEKLLDIAIKQNIPNAKFILCDFFDFETDEKYDGIIAFDSFFHIPKEKQEKIYPNVFNLMKNGSYMLFTHGNKNGEKIGKMFGEEFYYSALNTLDVHRLLSKAGFTIELSIENYTEENDARDLLIVAKKIRD